MDTFGFQSTGVTGVTQNLHRHSAACLPPLDQLPMDQLPFLEGWRMYTKSRLIPPNVY
jgi:hypothetical protein